MLTTALLVLTLGSPPGLQPPGVQPDPGEQVCTAIPPSPTLEDVTHVDERNADGSRVWGAEAIYELSSGDVGEASMLLPMVGDSIPQEFKCSGFGKKVMKAGKYMVAGLLGAGVAACCIVSQGVACIACGGAGAVGAMASAEFADGYCD